MSARLRPLFAAFVAALVAAPGAAVADPMELRITADRSSIAFTSTAPAERIVGTADGLSGTIRVDLDALESTTGTIEFPVANMRTGNQMRDRHMRGSDWLNGGAHPSIRFTIERLENVTANPQGDRTDVTADAVGQVEVNGVAAPARARVQVALLSSTRTARIQPTFTVRLADHRVTGARGAIGDTVGETIEIEGTIYAAWE